MRLDRSVVEEESSRLAGIGLVIDFIVDIFEDAFLGRRGAFLSELRRGIGFRLLLGIDGLVLFLFDDLLGHESVIEDSEGVVLVFVLD